MVDLYPEDITSEAKEETVGANAEDATDKEADGEAEEEE
jgi:hypothetical protein